MRADCATLDGMFRRLDASKIVSTTRSLGKRIAERFPESGLSRVSQELLTVATEAEAELEKLRRPLWPIRLAAVGVLVVFAGVAVAAVLTIRVRGEVAGIAELLQGIEAGINDVVFLGIAIYFLLTLEMRIKRRPALRALHELLSIAHVIDMHQLTKDPEQLLSPHRETASSPARGLSRFELVRYLDYCSELLSIVSKLAALRGQYLDDPVVLDVASGVQNLSASLSGKIWQKIMILDAVATRAGEPAS